MSEYRDCRKAVANAKPYPRSQWCESIGGKIFFKDVKNA